MNASILVLVLATALAAGACGDDGPASADHDSRDGSAGAGRRDAGTRPADDAGMHPTDDPGRHGDGMFQSDSDVTAAEPCDAPVCGDGHATECFSPRNQREACDGDDLRGLSCADHGFAGGQLACSSECAIDTSQCELCASDARIDQCTAIETLPGYSYGLGLAWRNGLLLVATAIGPQSAVCECDSHPLRLLAFDADLKAMGKPRELGLKKAWIIGLVAVPDGFLLAYVDGWAGRGAPMRTQHLDPNGAPDAEPIDHAGVEGGILVARPDGGPLFIANPAPAETLGQPDGGVPPPPNPPRAGEAVLAILLDEQGHEVWATTTTGSRGAGELTAGAYTGDGFLFPLDFYPSDPSIWHIDLDGNLAPNAWAIPAAGDDGVASYPQIAWDGSSASVVWSDIGADDLVCPKPEPSADRDGGTHSVECERVPSELRWAKLDHGAALTDGPATLSGVTRAPTRWIANAEDHVLVTGLPTATTGVTSGLLVRRFDSSLEPSGDPVELVREPEKAPVDTDSTPQNVDHVEAAFGPERSVFVAWTRVSEQPRYGLLGIAKIAR